MKKCFSIILTLALLITGAFIPVRSYAADGNYTYADVNTHISATISDGQDDIYCIKVPETGVLTITGNQSSTHNLNVLVYDSNQNELSTDSGNWLDNKLNGQQTLYLSGQFVAGTYYVKIHNNDSKSALNYDFFLKFTGVKPIKSGSPIADTLLYKEYGLYQISVSQRSIITIKGTSEAHSAQTIYLLDSTGNEIDEDNSGDWTTNQITGLDKITFSNTVSAGTYFIKIKNQLSASLTCNFKVNVSVPATKIKVSSKKVTIKKGRTYTVKATLSPSSSTDKVKWTSTNKKVATVSRSGKIIGKGRGTAHIIGTATNGATVNIKVTIK